MANERDRVRCKNWEIGHTYSFSGAPERLFCFEVIAKSKDIVDVCFLWDNTVGSYYTSDVKTTAHKLSGLEKELL